MAELSEEVLDEVESLVAIFENEITSFKEDLYLIVQYKSELFEITFRLNDSYPHQPPMIEVYSDGMPNEPLQNILQTYAIEESISAAPSLYNIITKAQELKPKNAEENIKQVCKFFLKGNCRFGDKCMNKHPGHQSKQSNKETSVEEQGKRLSSTSTNQNKKHKDENQQNKEIETPSKKVSMRTATDVIQRIMWDNSFPTDQFIVGYLDRFKGVLEKNFNDFSWEDIATVDYNVLAIPKHRIQYFKFKDTKIWDKNERLDKVFGSTGATELIHDIMSKYGHTDDEKYEQHDVNKNIDNDNNTTLEMHKTTTSTNKNRPNYFVCFRITDRQVVENVKKLQQHILELDDRLQDAMIGPNNLHVTLFMMRLNNESEQRKAKEVLQSLEVLLNLMLPSYGEPITLHGVNCFRDLVLFVNVRYHAILMKFQEFAILRFKGAGIHLCGNHDVYTPHMTVMKFSRPLCKQLNFTGISPHYYEQYLCHSFGIQSISGLRLCLTGPERAEDEFYVTYGRVVNSIFSLSDNLPSLIQRNLDKLVSKKICAFDQGCRLSAQLDKIGGKSGFEKTIYEALTMLKNIKINDNNKFFFILRGLPGSGKSFLVEKLVCSIAPSVTHVVCSADTFFGDKQGSYEFSGMKINEAHLKCIRNVIKEIENETDYIIVDNTNTTRWEYEIYERIALLCGYQSHIFEIPCENFETSRIFQKRCIHEVKASIHRRMYETWENDLNATPVNVNEKSISIHSLLEASRKFKNNLHPSNVLYAALFLDEASKQKLFSLFPAKLKHVFGDHVTLIYQPSLEDLQKLKIGEYVDVVVEKYFETPSIQLLSVKEIVTNYSKIKHTHVTIATYETVKPKYSLQILEQGNVDGIIPVQRCILSGKIGLRVPYSPTSSWKCTDPDAVAKCLNIGHPRRVANIDAIFEDESCDKMENDDVIIKDNNPSLQKTSINEVSLRMTSHLDTIKEIYVFDFDGTLFHTPSSKQGRLDYVKFTGMKWPNRSWLGHNGSLSDPLLIHPGPSLSEYHDHVNRSNSVTVLLTGRCEIVRKGVEAVLRQHRMKFDHIILKPDNKKERFSAESVYKYKKFEIARLLSKYSNAHVLKFWDDRQENIEVIEELKGLSKSVDFYLYHVEEVQPDFYKMPPVQLIKKSGLRRSEQFQNAAVCGIQFIKSCWLQVISTDCKWITDLTDTQSDMLIQPFGSYLLKRAGDVDLCLLGPVTGNIAICIERLAEKLIQHGATFCHVASNIRCPRIKLKLHFNLSPPVEYDIVVACLIPANEAEGKNLFSANEIDLNHLCKNMRDAKSKISVEGRMYFQKVQRRIESELPLEDFAIFIDLLCQILQKNHLKGNVYHCVRTFHIVDLASKFIQDHMPHDLKTTGTESMKDFEKLLKQFFAHYAVKESSFYQKLFKNFVPDLYIEPLKTFFSKASSTSLEQLFLKGPVLDNRDNQTGCITVVIKTTSKLTQWKAEILLQYKVGSAIRSMIDQGIIISPNLDNGDNVSFYTSDVEKSKVLLEDMKNQFYLEFDDIEVRITS